MTRRRKTIRFVVDATVVQAAGGSDRPTSSACRTFLYRLRSVCHHVVLTPEIREEWDPHESLVSKVWRASMTSWRKVDALSPAKDDTLRGMVAARVRLAGERRQIEKDLRLVEAALKADRVVVSMDERARRAFATLAPHSESLGSVRWINPVNDRDRLIAWMEGSATADKHWRLGG